MLAPGDYDGDGRADGAAYRRRNSVFYVKCTANGTVLMQALGSAAETPVAVRKQQ